MKLAALAAAAVLAVAAPVAAQMPPPPPGEMPDGGNSAMHGRNPMFAAMSPAGRQTMHMAMRGADPQADHAATQAARDRMLAILDADRLDATALKRAMDDEREASNTAKIRHQTAMIAGFQQLSLADRRAFVANAKAMRSRIEERMGAMRGRRGMGGGMGAPGDGGPGMMPPPQE